jgi:hypothetical protein
MTRNPQAEKRFLPQNSQGLSTEKPKIYPLEYAMNLLFPRFKSKPVKPVQSRRFKTPASKLVIDPTLPANAVFPGSGPVVDLAQCTYVRVYAARSRQWERVRETAKKRQSSAAAIFGQSSCYGISKLRQHS